MSTLSIPVAVERVTAPDGTSHFIFRASSDGQHHVIPLRFDPDLKLHPDPSIAIEKAKSLVAREGRAALAKATGHPPEVFSLPF